MWRLNVVERDFSMFLNVCECFRLFLNVFDFLFECI